MALALVQSADALVTMTPERRGTAASAVLRNPAGTAKVTVTGTLDTVDTTVATVGTTRELMTLTSGTGVTVGRRYWYTSTSGGWSARVRVAAVAGALVTLDAPLPGDQTAGDTFKGLAFTATVPAANLGTRGRDYRLDWSITVGSETDKIRQMAHVVATPFRQPVTIGDVARVAFEDHPSWARAQSPGKFLLVAEDANAAVEEALESVEDFPDRIGDHEAFRRAGALSIRVELARCGRAPAGFDPALYVADNERRLATMVRAALGGKWIDRDDDGIVSDDEARGLGTIAIEFV